MLQFQFDFQLWTSLWWTQTLRISEVSWWPNWCKGHQNWPSGLAKQTCQHFASAAWLCSQRIEFVRDRGAYVLQLKEDDIYCLDQANPIADALQIEALISGLECQNVRNIWGWSVFQRASSWFRSISDYKISIPAVEKCVQLHSTWPATWQVIQIHTTEDAAMKAQKIKEVCLRLAKTQVPGRWWPPVRSCQTAHWDVDFVSKSGNH